MKDLMVMLARSVFLECPEMLGSLAWFTRSGLGTSLMHNTVFVLLLLGTIGARMKPG